MLKMGYEDYKVNYIIAKDPKTVRNLIREVYIPSQELKIKLDIYDDKDYDLEKNNFR
jgi:hypothetical protein